jgi:GAF domain-containing protein
VAPMRQDDGAVLTRPARVAAVRRLSGRHSRPRAAVESILRATAVLLDVPVVSVALVDDSHELVWVTSAPEQHRERAYTIDRSLCAIVVAAGEEVAISDVRGGEELTGDVDGAAIASLRGVESYLGVPLIVDGDLCLGTVCAYGDGIQEWTERERLGLRHVTEAVAQLLAPIAQGREHDERRVRGLERDMQRLLAEHSAVRRVATIAAHSREPHAVFQAVVEELSHLLDHAPVLLARLRHGEVVPIAAAPGTTEDEQTDMCAAWADASGPASDCSGVVANGDGSIAGAPVSVGGNVWGVLLAEVSEGRDADPVDRLEQFTELLTIAIENARQRRRLTAWAGLES